MLELLFIVITYEDLHKIVTHPLQPRHLTNTEDLLRQVRGHPQYESHYHRMLILRDGNQILQHIIIPPNVHLNPPTMHLLNVAWARMGDDA